MKVAYITAIYGNYEASVKPFQKQSVDVDFICFTDISNIDPDGWIIDTTPYHLTNPSKLDTGSQRNSLANNKHTFNIAKFYKQNFYNIPRLTEYDVVIWLDATIEIINPKSTEYVLERLKLSPVVGWTHEHRSGRLEEELGASNWGEKYVSTHWLGQDQPYQDVNTQYTTYLQNGYTDDYWIPYRENNPNVGVWITCFVGFDLRNPNITTFLDAWYTETLTHTTQDQLSFPYVCQSLNIVPYSLPDTIVRGDRPHTLTDLYYKHHHGR